MGLVTLSSGSTMRVLTCTARPHGRERFIRAHDYSALKYRMLFKICDVEPHVAECQKSTWSLGLRNWGTIKQHGRTIFSVDRYSLRVHTSCYTEKLAVLFGCALGFKPPTMCCSCCWSCCCRRGVLCSVSAGVLCLSLLACVHLLVSVVFEQD